MNNAEKRIILFVWSGEELSQMFFFVDLYHDNYVSASYKVVTKETIGFQDY